MQSFEVHKNENKNKTKIKFETYGSGTIYASPIIARLVLKHCINGSGSSSVNQSQLNAVNSVDNGYVCHTGVNKRLFFKYNQ
jgi:hypothetical protein